MKKLIVLVCILGLLATGSTAIAGSNDAVGAAIMYQLLKSMVKSGDTQEEEYIIEEYNFSDMIQVNISNISSKPGVVPHTGGYVFKEKLCFAAFTITDLPGGADNFFYRNGLKVGDKIAAFKAFNKGTIEKFSFKCDLPQDSLRQILYNSIGDIMMDSNEPPLWIRVIDIELWPNGNLKTSTFRDFHLKY